MSKDWAQGTDVHEEPMIDRTAMLAGLPMAEFTGRATAATLGVIALDMAMIVAAAALCVAFWSPLLYILTLMFIAGRQVGIATIALHDGVHGMLLKDRRQNDLLAKAICWMVMAPPIVDFDQFRAAHLAHHRAINGKDDPDMPMLELIYNAHPYKLGLHLLLWLSGLVALRLVITWARASWQRSVATFAVVAGLAAGVWFSVRWCELLVLYYIVPFVTWGMFVNTARAMVEHYPAGCYQRPEMHSGVLLTREVIPTWFDIAFVCTRNLNYHFTHHLFPAVPSIKVRNLQRHLARSPAYQQVAHVTHGYHKAVAELLFREHKSSASGLAPS